MVKIKIIAFWTDTIDREREDIFYVDEYNEEAKQSIYNWIRSYFIENIPTNEELEKIYDLQINIEGPAFLCDLCYRETEKLYTISLLEISQDYAVCEKCFQKIKNRLEELKEENLKWRTEILGKK